MGSYRDAVAVGNETGTPPDITSVETTGAHKYGYYINFEQPLANGGDTGIFGRAGFNDGQTEDYVYTEADRHVSFGGQLSGVRWHRQDDVLALALMQNDLSSAHAAYLANGGLGFLLGDGKLDYAPERTLESYYNYNLSRHSAATAIFVSPDYQYVCDPGYNKDRGPVSVASMRLHIEF
jgi:carbohydrate-selective porin OprB